MRKIVTTLMAASALVSATELWELSMKASLTGGVHTYNDNWTGEESGNITWLADFNGSAHKQISDLFRTENNLIVQYGQTYNQHKDTANGYKRSWEDPKVSADEIDFNNRELITFEAISPYVGFRSQTTFMNQNEDNDSVKYANPVKLTESIGVSKKLLEDNKQQSLEFRLAGAVNQNINRKIETDNDGGVEFVTEYSVDNKDGYLGYKTYLNLYKPVAVSNEDIRDTKLSTVDVDWKNEAYVNVNRFIVISYGMRMIYDKVALDDVQVKNSLTAGFNITKTNVE